MSKSSRCKHKQNIRVLLWTEGVRTEPLQNSSVFVPFLFCFCPFPLRSLIWNLPLSHQSICAKSSWKSLHVRKLQLPVPGRSWSGCSWMPNSKSMWCSIFSCNFRVRFAWDFTLQRFGRVSLYLRAFSGRCLSHATKRSTRRSKSRRDSRRPWHWRNETSQHETCHVLIFCFVFVQHCVCGSYEILWASLTSNNGSNFEAYWDAAPSLANKRLDSSTVMSWRHSSGTYHQTCNFGWKAQKAQCHVSLNRVILHIHTDL